MCDPIPDYTPLRCPLFCLYRRDHQQSRVGYKGSTWIQMDFDTLYLVTVTEVERSRGTPERSDGTLVLNLNSPSIVGDHELVNRYLRTEDRTLPW